MSTKVAIALLALAGLVGIAFGYFLRWIITLGKRSSVELETKQMMLDAKEEAKKLVSDAENKAEETIKSKQKDLQEREGKIKNAEERLVKKEDRVDKRQVDVDKEKEEASKKLEKSNFFQKQAKELKEKQAKTLEKVAEMSFEEAKQELLKKIKEQNEEDIFVRMQKLESAGKETLEEKAKQILTNSIHRFGNSVASDVTTSTVPLPSEEVKGRIIGKEGRNIKAFEKATGVELIIDDTPNTIILSSFAPVRRQVAKVALENLILDGRIQPVKIEETVEKAREEINKTIQKKGEEAAYECGVYNYNSNLISILGRLYFRSSYGQNMLQHSIEVSLIAGMLAEEIGLNVMVAKTTGLFHDIGKAVDHETQGTHVEIGRRILQKFKVDEKIIKAMQSHHEEYPYETPESMIVQTADAISASRPGARRETAENYLKRLEDLEAIATNSKGVEKAYAVQAGREIRVFVTPEEISDFEAKELAKEITHKIQNELNYPGEIKVNVIRETRVVEYAR